MHPQLSEHRAPQCAELIRKLQQCHNENIWTKYFGECNEAKVKLTECLRAERVERTQKNLQEAREKRAKLEQAWKEFDES
ncbi:hypothetical protein IWQ60_011100 [Tieghemiomyces parasiticus]|uniref:COX assembly mitochondrial protein n=1 Tax=Tieghemiomyces parasiticus TaxID=78921 RepID=A0A9W7ZR88_9FUNG|nr:hypothetical protein IWQ60_011100 [Tieghemiomyces parasiticus]